ECTAMARPEVTGRKTKATGGISKKQRRNRGPPTHAFSIQEFCDSHRVSRSKFYELRAKGLTPDEMDVDGSTRISVESAARWRRQREREAVKMQADPLP